MTFRDTSKGELKILVGLLRIAIGLVMVVAPKA